MTLRRTMVVIGLAVAGWSAVATGARATYGTQVTADEPQYLLSALSLAEDHDLDISDERSDARYRPFHDAALPVQEEPDDQGRRLSPHDPLLPVVLAVPMAIGGWVAAKLVLAVAAGALAASMVWVGVRRLDLPLGVTALTVLAFGVASPLAIYGTQVYPEVPAALAGTLALAALTGPLRRASVVLLAVSVVALPWLSVKFVAVAAMLAALGIGRLLRAGNRRTAFGLVVALALAGAGYVLFHHAVYGGWTVYAAGDHFVGGEQTVVGHDPDYVARTTRLVGLLADRGFGLAAWQPGWLLIVPALGALARRRPPFALTLALPLTAGWAGATWLALTMHGWWWPGRQVVVVLPAAVLVIAWWVASAAPFVRRVVVAAGAIGAATYVWLVAEVLLGHVTLVVDFEATANPFYRAWRLALPDYRDATAATWVLHAAWIAVIGTLAVAGWRSASGRARGCQPRPEHVLSPEPPTRSVVNA